MGSNILVDEGFLYRFEKNGGQKTIQRCVRFKNKCRGRVHVIGDINIMRQFQTAINEMKINAKCKFNSKHSVIGILSSQVPTIFL